MTQARITPQIAKHLLHLLTEDSRISAQLVDLLLQERKALETRNYTHYQELIEAKKGVLINLESVDRERRSVLDSLGYSADNTGVTAFIAQLPPAWQARFQTLWTELTSNLQQCRHLNEVNGRILNQSQQALDRLMSFLRGVSPQQSIYNRQGKKGLLAGNRSLAMA